MPIRPIDMQVLLPKSQNVSKMSQDMANKSENHMQQSFNENKKVAEKKLTKVNKKEKKENASVKTDDKAKLLYGKDKKNKDNETSNSTATKIDIRV